MVGSLDETMALVSLVATGVIAAGVLLFRRHEIRQVLALSKRTIRRLLGSIIGLSVTTMLMLYFLVKTIGKARNPGMVHAITNTDVVLVVLASAVLFRSPLTPANLIGILIITVGLSLVTR